MHTNANKSLAGPLFILRGLYEVTLQGLMAPFKGTTERKHDINIILGSPVLQWDALHLLSVLHTINLTFM